MINSLVKLLLGKFNLKISRTIHESEVPIDVICSFIQKLEPQKKTKLVRLGSINDGGYVVPMHLDGIAKLFSPGCDGLVDFERDLYEKYSIPSIVLDQQSKKPEPLENYIEFQENWLDATTTSKTISLPDWVRQNSKSTDILMLQMDIEGAEYEVLRNTPTEILNQFHTIIIEFHYFEMIKNSYLFDTKIKPAFSSVLKNHIPVFVNANNCCGEVQFYNLRFPRVFEITFLHKSKTSDLKDEEYVELAGYKNVESNPDITINWKSFLRT